jgi:D-3-phosphoglycerate dehydrogenase / 2-oxoglutarate reductase
MKILANDGISAIGKSTLENAGFTVITDKVDQNQLIGFINDHTIDMLLVRSATTARKEMIDACPSLKLIGRGGVGMDNIDVAYAREKGLHVINTPGASSPSVAELVMGQLFSMSRFLHDSFKNMPTIGAAEFNTLKKNYAKGVELSGKTLLIIGFGKIGRALAAYALGCGMKVRAVDIYTDVVSIPLHISGLENINVNITPTDFLSGELPHADYISIHVPKQKDGSAVLGKAEFDLMKTGVRLANAARGGVIDEMALIEALDSGKVAAAALDVFENEPTPNDALLKHPKIAATPHIGAATNEAQDRVGLELAETIIGIFK